MKNITRLFLGCMVYCILLSPKEVTGRTLRDLIDQQSPQLSLRQASSYGMSASSAPSSSAAASYSSPSTSYSSASPSSSSSYASPSSPSSSSSQRAAVAKPSELVYVYGYAPPPPSQGNGGAYMLYQGLTAGMVVVPVNQLNQMFAAGAPVLTPLSNSVSQYFVPSSSSSSNSVSSNSPSSSSYSGR